MDLPLQRVVSPVETEINKDIFVINDVELRIPPSQIEIRKEDLTYHYRTLRSKVATKVPTGNGQATIHVSIVFTDDLFLTLHRLITQIKANPFCYIDNRFIRESIVPDWPYSQNMAFTVTGLALNNLQGATNAMVLELDALWFNYFPYMHNFLFREDWQTNWLRSENGLVSFSIGWLLNSQTYDRQYYSNVIGRLEEGNSVFDSNTNTLIRGAKPSQLVESWSVIQGKFGNDQSKTTIYEMEQQSPGAEFDLLPIPGNMMPARIVSQAANSRIYVRYCNFLQRDALLKNFGIDVRADLIDYEDQSGQPGLFDSLFSVGQDSDGLPTVLGLHSFAIPRALREKWISKMLETNYGVKFHFNAYKEIRLPQKFTDKMENKKNQAIADLFTRVQAINTPVPASGDGDNICIPVLNSPYPITSDFASSRLDPVSKSFSRSHDGIDMGAPHGTHIVVPENEVNDLPATVIKVGLNDKNAGNYVVVRSATGDWYFMHMDLVAVAQGQHVVKGNLLGTVGNTGRTTRIDVNGNTNPSRGFHLHLGLKVKGSSSFSNPRPYLQRIVDEQVAAANAIEPVSSTEPYFDYEPASLELTDDEKLLQLAQSKAKEDLALTDEETNELTELFELLDSEGWSYYDYDITVTNVWKKLYTLEVQNNGINRWLNGSVIPEDFRQQGIVLSNITGSLSHIVAKIPVLGHEFPTQQHLGSIEPEYQMEFAVIDDQGGLDGISEMAQMIQGMRSLLMNNSRKFRAVVDGWCMSVDSFITRMFGSYEVNDFQGLRQDGRYTDFKLKKRLITSSSYEGTIPGNPGLSTLTLNFSETNPYEVEHLTSSAPSLQDKDEARKQVLQALYNLDFAPKYKDVILPIFIAQKLGTHLSDYGSPDYGKFTLDQLSGYFTPDMTTNALLYQTSPDQPSTLLLRASSPSDIDFLRSLGIGADYFYADGEKTDYLQVDPSVLQPYWAANGYTTPPINEAQGFALGENARNVALNNLFGIHGNFAIGQQLPTPVPTDIPVGQLTDSQTFAIGENARNAITGGRYIYWDNTSPPPDKLYPNQEIINRTFDISDLIEQNPELVQIPFTKLMDYYTGIGVVLKTGNRIFAENEVGGFDKSFVSNQLYDLPARTDMWKAWQMYLEEFCKVSNTLGASNAITELHSNPNWPVPGSIKSNPPFTSGVDNWSDPLPESDRYVYASIAQKYFGIYRTATGMASDLTFGLPGEVITGGFASISPEVDLATIYRTKHETAVSRLVNRYMTDFPIQLQLPDYLKQTYQYLIGNLLGNSMEDERGKVPALDSLRDRFYANAYSCGNISYDTFRLIADNPVWNSGKAGTPNEVHGGLGGIANVFATSIDAFATPRAAIQGVDSNGNSIGGFSLGALQTAGANAFTQATGTENLLFPAQQVGMPFGSPFDYPTDQDVETVKIKYIKGLLAAFADGIIGDYGMLEALGLTKLAYSDQNRDISGVECYPDLALPAHPYYQSITQTYPDFYMWNIYEDGGALNPQMIQQIQQKAEFVLDNCYTSMKRIEKGDNYDERRDTLIPETGIDDPLILQTKMSAEGSDGNDQGTAMATPFYPTKLTSQSVEDWKKVTSAVGKSPRIYSDKPSEQIEGIRLANTEGLYGAGGNVQYPTRVGPASYAELQRQFESTNQLFGSKEGYLQSELNPQNAPQIHDAIQGTPSERPPEAGHFFDPKSLKKLAADSAKDLISQKMSLKRAFPTFKLYFIEEDEFETRFINYDDFYSYNAVKEITVVQSRKIAADTAVIKVQNIAGTLDGTRRNSIVDLDYYSTSTLKQKLDSHSDVESNPVGGDPLTTGTQSDQPFGSVVLRPGLNIQLRMGFSNDPNTLQVMISGRIVDVTWNTTGDLAEIMVQSFGTELTQAIKGNSRDGNFRTFYTTHELLGSMMLEPEVVHFGRWEFGQTFQQGEASDYKLDFTDYSREGWIGRFGVTNALSQFIMNHPILIAGAAGLVTALNFVPVGKILSGSKLFTGVATKLGLPLVEGTAGYTAILAGTRTGEEALEFSARTKAFALAGSAIEQIGELALKKVGNPEFDAFLGQKFFEASKDLAKATTVEEGAAILKKFESIAQTSVFKNRFMAKPWVALSEGGYWTSVGLKKPLGTALGLVTGVPTKLALQAFTVAIGADLLVQGLLNPIYQYTIGGARKFFSRTEAELFLTPQDDNLFPPHPKDYMTLDRSVAQKAAQLGLHVVSVSLFNTTAVAQGAYNFFYPDQYVTKKVAPEACQYQIVSSTIWDLFHEMSIRHPGWVYGTRPYGNTFRYTMFFGLPAQRYWARPASSAFIQRANQLRTFLDNGLENPDNTLITEGEFKRLYGDKVFQEISERIDLALDSDAAYQPQDRNTSLTASSTPQWDWQADDAANQLTREQIRNHTFNTQMTSLAIQEYLRAVQIRFEPFRRYHLLSSDRDLVWNGIMGSEQAVSNAVDITYFEDPTVKANDLSAQVNTAVFKAHSFIPEYKLRIAPVRWYNCKGYGMAMRYAMGELLHRMRDMYRGEVISLGNPRIRPWDVAILMDSYNDMVGPIEVEQVVHTFSHETGYLTEIKPSAVVFANEISGWPLIEAMKLWALAVHDVHNRYLGMKNDDSKATNPGSTLAAAGGVASQILETARKTSAGLATGEAGLIAAGPLGGAVGFIAGTNIGGPLNGDKFDSYIKQKYKRLFGDNGATLDQVFADQPPPNLDVVDKSIQHLVAAADRFSTGVGIAGAAFTLSGSLVGATALYQSLGKTVGAQTFDDLLTKSGGAFAKEGAKFFAKNPLSWVAGGALLTGLSMAAVGAGAPLVIDQIDFPGAAFLVGGSMLFLQCLKNDALVVVPLTKSGNPIIAGLAYNDPQMLWKTFRGTINRWASDTIEGTTDLISLYKRYGSALWESVDDPKLGITASNAFGVPDSPSLQAMTGER